MNINPIIFENLTASLGMDESTTRLSLSLPPVLEGALHFRAFCFSELLIQRADLGELLGVTWAEVKKVYTYNRDTVIALIQFNLCAQAFPLEFHVNALMGHKDSIVMQIRRIERDLPDKIKAWKKVTQHGMKVFDSSHELLRAMKTKCEFNHANHGRVMSP